MPYVSNISLHEIMNMWMELYHSTSYYPNKYILMYHGIYMVIHSDVMSYLEKYAYTVSNS